MIAYLDGIIRAKQEDTVIIDVGGVGYEVHLAASALVRLKEGGRARVYTYLNISETAHALFGFLTQDERALFKLLITVSGIGPKSAMNVLSKVRVPELCGAIQRGDCDLLRALGLGQKTAERIILELSGKIEKLGFVYAAQPSDTGGDKEVIDALRNLGYSPLEAREAIKCIPSEVKDVGDKIKHALQFLSK